MSNFGINSMLFFTNYHQKIQNLEVEKGTHSGYLQVRNLVKWHTWILPKCSQSFKTTIASLVRLYHIIEYNPSATNSQPDQNSAYLTRNRDTTNTISSVLSTVYIHAYLFATNNTLKGHERPLTTTNTHKGHDHCNYNCWENKRKKLFRVCLESSRATEAEAWR